MKMTLFSLILFFSVNSFAGFYIEPGLSYEKGDNTLDWPPPFSSSTGSTQGLGVNLKLGFDIADIFFAGVDASYSKPQFKNSANDYDASSTSQSFGVIAGAQMPIFGFRLWGGYVFDGLLDPEKYGDIDVKFSGATGPKIGVGFRLFMFSANVEYMDLTYKTSTLESPGVISGTLDSEFKNKVLVVIFSMPFTL